MKNSNETKDEINNEMNQSQISKQKYSFNYDPLSESLSLSNISLANPNVSNLGDEESKKNKKYGHFILGERLGQGTFGFVRVATHTLTGEKVAIKILDKEKIIKQKDKVHLKNEIKVLKKLRHNNIVQLYGVIDTKLSINLIMEYIEGEELLDFINRKHRLKEMEACIIFQQIISGLEYLSKNNISHRDIKPENILINKDNLRIKIVDFGLSKIYKDNELLKSKCGSLCFAAPEMISGKKYNGSISDIWSSGVTLFSMISGFLPFQEDDTQLVYQKIIKGKYQIPYYISQNARDLISRILNVIPHKRYTFEQIKKHRWFKMLDPSNTMREGLLLDKHVIPIDEDIINIMVKKYDFNEEEVKINLLKNKHNLITTTFYLLLNRKIKDGKSSVCDLRSTEFISYINDENNLLENYDYNLDKVCQERVNANCLKKNLVIQEKNKKFKDRNAKSDIFKEEISLKLRKLHKEMDDIKNILNSQGNDEFSERNEYSQPRTHTNKKSNLRNLVINEDISTKMKIKKDYNTSKKHPINYSSLNSLINKDKENNVLDKITNKNDNDKIAVNTVSNMLNSISNNREVTMENNINSTISYRQNNTSKKNVFRLTKKDNNIKKRKLNSMNLEHPIHFNKSNKSKMAKTNKNKNVNIMKNYDFQNNKSVPKDYSNKNNNINNTTRERKNYKLSNIKTQDTKKNEKRKASIDLIYSSYKKDNNFSSRLFNSNNINHNKHLFNANNYINSTNNNQFSMTIDKNEKFKSIYPRRNKYTSYQTIVNNSSQKDKTTPKTIKPKHKNKISIIIKPKNKYYARDIIFNKKNCNTVQNNQENNNIIKKYQTHKKNNDIIYRNNKNVILPSNSVLIKKNKKNELKMNLFKSCVNMKENNSNKELIKRINRNNINKSSLKNNLKNNLKNKDKIKIKDEYIPFDLNSILIANKKRSIYDNISLVLSKENINYIIQKNKIVCWKNKFHFELMVYPNIKSEVISKINAINKNGKVSVYKSTINNIINRLSN